MVIDNVDDFMREVNDLLLYVTGIPQSRLIRGNQSRSVLPKENDYIIYTPITQVRHGTNIATLYAEDIPIDENAPETDEKLLQIDIQIDCYGDKAFAYAEGIETFAGSLRCNDYLRQNNMVIRVLYASNPIDGTLIDDTRQYVSRWIVTLSICRPVSTTDKIPWIEEAQVVPNPPMSSDPSGVKLKNIDIVYKE